MRGVLINCIFMILCCGGKNLFRRLGCHLKSLAFFLLVNIYVKLYIHNFICVIKRKTLLLSQWIVLFGYLEYYSDFLQRC